MAEEAWDAMENGSREDQTNRANGEHLKGRMETPEIRQDIREMFRV